MPSYISYPPNSPWLAALIADAIWIGIPLYRSALLLPLLTNPEGISEQMPEVRWVITAWIFAGLFHVSEIFMSVTNMINLFRGYYCIKIVVGVMYKMDMFGVPTLISNGLVDFCQKHFERMRRLPGEILGVIKNPKAAFNELKKRIDGSSEDGEKKAD